MRFVFFMCTYVSRFHFYIILYLINIHRWYRKSEHINKVSTRRKKEEILNNHGRNDTKSVKRYM